MGRRTGSSPLDDFLAGADSSTDTGELLQRLGLLGSLTGIALATGVVVFLATTHRGSRSEVALLVRVAMIAGLVTVVGAAVEIAGVASLNDVGWFDAFTDSPASAAMMRLLAGLMIALGLTVDTVPNADDDPRCQSGEPVRWSASPVSAFGVGGLVIGVLSFAFDGHTVTEGPRAVHAGVNAVHVAAGGVWFGGVVALAIVSWSRRRAGVSTAALVIRFSSVATVALIGVALAGVLMALMITDGIGDFTGTDWGRTLVVKTVAVALVVAVGAYNHFRVVPALERDPDPASIEGRARATVTAEAVVLTCVAVATVFLSVASTN